MADELKCWSRYKAVEDGAHEFKTKGGPLVRTNVGVDQEGEWEGKGQVGGAWKQPGRTYMRFTSLGSEGVSKELHSHVSRVRGSQQLQCVHVRL